MFHHSSFISDFIALKFVLHSHQLTIIQKQIETFSFPLREQLCSDAVIGLLEQTAFFNMRAYSYLPVLPILFIISPTFIRASFVLSCSLVLCCPHSYPAVLSRQLSYSIVFSRPLSFTLPYSLVVPRTHLRTLSYSLILSRNLSYCLVNSRTLSYFFRTVS